MKPLGREQTRYTTTDEDSEFCFSFSIFEELKDSSLCVGCCLLFVLGCFLFVCCCVVVVVVCCLLFVVCCLLFVVCCLLFVVC